MSPEDQLKKDIKDNLGQVNDGLVMGDTVFSVQSTSEGIINDVKDRIGTLEKEKEELEKEIDRHERRIQTSNRDFSDVKDTLPEPLPNRVLYFIEDYTLAFLSIAYLIMIMAITTFQIQLSSEAWWKVLMECIAGFGTLTVFLFMLLYYLC
jgi:hypothetical protein